MSLLCDKQIIDLCTFVNGVDGKMIEPFTQENVRFNNNHKILSYGVSTVGYDVTLSKERAAIFEAIEVPDNNHSHVRELVEIDPLKFDDRVLKELKLLTDEETGHEYFLMPPHSFLLGYTNEYFKMPEDVAAVCFGKSTYARCGVIVNVTPIEPGFEGNVVLEFSNTTPCPVRIYAAQGVCQFIFHKTSMRPAVTYADKNGKYQAQRGITLPKG